MSSRAADFAYLDWPGPIPWAHRGGASEVPENTMPAFEHAVGLGYRYVETDVHRTSDGALLAFHDDVLDRVTDRTGVIAELPWSVVREARVDGPSRSRCSRTCWAPGPTSASTSTPSTTPPSTRWSRCCGAPGRSTGCASGRSATSAWPGCATPSPASARRSDRAARSSSGWLPRARRRSESSRPRAPSSPHLRRDAGGHRGLGGRGPPPGDAGARVDDRRARGDGPAARPRRRRPHDRPPGGAQGGPPGPGPVAGSDGEWPAGRPRSPYGDDRSRRLSDVLGRELRDRPRLRRPTSARLTRRPLWSCGRPTRCGGSVGAGRARAGPGLRRGRLDVEGDIFDGPRAARALPDPSCSRGTGAVGRLLGASDLAARRRRRGGAPAGSAPRRPRAARSRPLRRLATTSTAGARPSLTYSCAVFEDATPARASAGSQARADLPQARAGAGHAAARRRLRVGVDGACTRPSTTAWRPSA